MGRCGCGLGYITKEFTQLTTMWYRLLAPVLEAAVIDCNHAPWLFVTAMPVVTRTNGEELKGHECVSVKGLERGATPAAVTTPSTVNNRLKRQLSR